MEIDYPSYPTEAELIAEREAARKAAEYEEKLRARAEYEAELAAKAEYEAELIRREAELLARPALIVGPEVPSPQPLVIPSSSPAIRFVMPADDVSVVDVVAPVLPAPAASANVELLAQEAALIATAGQTTGTTLISPEGNVVVVGPVGPLPTPVIEAQGTCIKGSVAFAPIVTLPTAAELLPLRPDLQLPHEGTPWPREPRSYVPPASRCVCTACDESTDCLAEPERQLEGFDQNEEMFPAVAGGVSTAQAVGGVGKAILIGVATGTLIWGVTKALDRLFFDKRR